MIIEGKRAFYLGAVAHIVDDSLELAWAEKFITPNPAHKYIVGRFVEADRANKNGQFISLDNLQKGKATLDHAPMNINHDGNPVGAYVASEILYPTEMGNDQPTMEALGAFWAYRYPDEFAAVRKAYKNSSLYFSMETKPERIHCGGDKGCGQEFAYTERFDPSYCAHLNDPSLGAQREMINPHFMGGALIIPPARPGWPGANVEQISKLMQEKVDDMENAYEDLKREMPEGDPLTWESIAMAFAVAADRQENARDFNAKARKALAKSGAAMPDGSFPIVTMQDLHNAIQAIGRAKDPAAARMHIMKRARAMGAMDAIPDSWTAKS